MNLQDGKNTLVTIDLGAGSGRIMLYDYINESLKHQEIHRFSKYVVGKAGSETWDISKIIKEIKVGLLKIKKAGYQRNLSIGIDTWGVDFGLLDKKGNLIANPFHYRNKIFSNTRQVHDIITFGDLYQRTGVQYMKFNTIYQIVTIKNMYPEMYELADRLLLIPDLIIYFLTKEISTEYTVASTTGLLNLNKKDWDWEIIDDLSLKRNLFTKIIMPGEKKSFLDKAISNELGLTNCFIYSVASHDTASAVLGTPLRKNEAFLSCGTWSILGVVENKPIINQSAIENNFSNEGNFDGNQRFLKNIVGFWILQETKRDWEKQNHILKYENITKKVARINSKNQYIDSDADIFHHSGDMISKINDYLKITNQKNADEINELVRIILESLALNFNDKCVLLEETINKRIDIIHIIGGGAKNEVFCQFTANATGKIVYSGPEEATATGNAIMQLLSMGLIQKNEVIKVIENSFYIKKYLPQNRGQWKTKIKDYRKICELYNSKIT
ncbi:rhamnulokinase family protein [Candidatus Izemoplasma sp. B36]|uniref:rhamnulokinase n=1 Tax=Candidatus Izemoplasma sp. B36 TaxID=3242468 RepID=UPI00355780C9